MKSPIYRRLDEAILADALDTVHALREARFIGLSNRRIVDFLRSSVVLDEVQTLSDRELLARWFEIFDREFSATRPKRASVR